MAPSRLSVVLALVAVVACATGPVTAGADGAIAAANAFGASRGGEAVQAAPAPMILTVETDPWSTDAAVSIFLHGAVDVAIDWGDGTRTRATTAGPQTHTYPASGGYTIRIAGHLEQFGRGAATHHGNRITGVTDWGDLGLVSLSGAFAQSHRLLALPPTLPSTVTDLSWLFEGTEFGGDVGPWDVSNVTHMAGMFSGGEDWVSFNPDIGGWDVSNVTDMSFMFAANHHFDRDIGGWDVSSVTDMAGMFDFTDRFDHDLGDWDVSNVTDMSGMFHNSSFGRDIGGWDVSNVTSMAGMFAADGFELHTFNHDIGGWDVSRVVDMRGMFRYNVRFDQDLSGWCVVRIPAEPPEFALGADAWRLPRPAWGTCPTR